jgi:hypothetical protein
MPFDRRKLAEDESYKGDCVKRKLIYASQMH